VPRPEAGPTTRSLDPDAPRALVIGCGALARELLEVTRRIPGLEVACLPPDLHNRPGGIPDAVRARIAEARRDGFERIFVAYADCGTGGLLEPVLAEAGVERLPGAHCYEVFAGSAEFAALADAEPGTFWLTDFLARNFERLVIRGLGIDRHPELQAQYFANYTRVVFLSQTDDPDLLALARRAADRLGLAFEHRPTGLSHLAAPILHFATGGATRASAVSGPVDSRPTSAHDQATHRGVAGSRPTSETADPARPTSENLAAAALDLGSPRPTRIAPRTLSAAPTRTPARVPTRAPGLERARAAAATSTRAEATR
jgi:hypothetical protein